jgi:hypothetical protein
MAPRVLPRPCTSRPFLGSELSKRNFQNPSGTGGVVFGTADGIKGTCPDDGRPTPASAEASAFETNAI